MQCMDIRMGDIGRGGIGDGNKNEEQEKGRNDDEGDAEEAKRQNIC